MEYKAKEERKKENKQWRRENKKGHQYLDAMRPATGNTHRRAIRKKLKGNNTQLREENYQKERKDKKKEAKKAKGKKGT